MPNLYRVAQERPVAVMGEGAPTPGHRYPLAKDRIALAVCSVADDRIEAIAYGSTIEEAAQRAEMIRVGLEALDA